MVDSGPRLPRFALGIPFLAVVLVTAGSYSAWSGFLFPNPKLSGGIGGLAVGDFNDDGRRDIVHGCVLHLANSQGTFEPRPLTACGRSVRVGNFNKDGNQDLAFGTWILLGKGDGTFVDRPILDVGWTCLDVVDLDADGDDDLILCQAHTDQISVYLSNGDGSFAAGSQSAAGDLPTSITHGDFNQDGRIDLAVANGWSNDLSVFLGIGDGTVSTQRRFSSGAYPSGIHSRDLNGDRIEDLAVANLAVNGVSILPGQGDGSFGAPEFLAAGQVPVSVALGDLNRDGHEDLAVANSASSDISVFLSTGRGTFAPALRVPAGSDPLDLVIADLNADARPDLVVSNSGNFLDDSVSLILNNPDGTFGAQLPVALSGESVAFPAIGDFDSSGADDLAIVRSAADQIAVHLSSGDGSFSLGQTVAAGDGPVAVVAGDLNGDGLGDLVAANSLSADVSVHLGRGDATFLAPLWTSGASGIGSMVVGQFNADNQLDLALIKAQEYEVSILQGAGDGTFPARVFSVFSSLPGPTRSPSAGDLNSDGIDDLTLVHFSGSGFVDSSVGVFLNQGDGHLLPMGASPFGTGRFPVAALISDVTADDKRDVTVVWSNYGESLGGLVVNAGGGDGTFSGFNGYQAGWNPGSVAAADFNADGLNDVAVANSTTQDVSVFIGETDGTLRPEARYAVAGHPSWVGIGDFDGDARNDLLLPHAYSESGASLLLGRGPMPDQDGDGMLNGSDACTDSDRDGAGDPGFRNQLCAEDNCPGIGNPSQENSDGDVFGDACDICALDRLNDHDDDEICGNADNCPEAWNRHQDDTDGDGLGDACDVCPRDARNDPDRDLACDGSDNCPGTPNRNQSDTDMDGVGDSCDTCPLDAGNDIDSDQICGNVDNCPGLPNLTQMDSDADSEGDACDLDDGLLYFTSLQPGSQSWQPESVYQSFNLYRGDLEQLRSFREYTQDPTTDLAERYCGLRTSAATDEFVPPGGTVVFYLVTGESMGTESSLGLDSSGAERLNSWPCH